MKKIIVVGTLVGLATEVARATIQSLRNAGNEVEIVERPAIEMLAVRPRPSPLDEPLAPPAYYGYGRKGKGEKKRAASALRGRGWK